MKRAVAYLRRSTDDKQANSLDVQRQEIAAYASEHGYEILHWYEDDGISGHDVDRDDFVRMIEHAESGSDFDYLLVRHQSRFARFRPAKTIRFLDRLDDAGVKLVTTKQGVIDIDDLAQFLIASIEAQTDHSYSKTLSEHTIRGQANQAVKGRSGGQRAPYGMDRVLCNQRGEHLMRLQVGERAPKSSSNYITFAPSDDPCKVAMVREIFAMFLGGKSPWSIAKVLNTRGIPAPRGGKWNKGTIRAMILNPIYCGDYRWNRRREGKFNSLAAGKAKRRPKSETAPDKTGRRKNAVFMNDPEDWIVTEDSHEGIIDKADWLAAQTRMNRMAKQKHPNRGSAASGGYRYALSGLVYCECGAKMHGRIIRKRKDGKEYQQRKYICYAYDSGGNCKYNWANAEYLHGKIVDVLCERLRDPETLDRLVAITRDAAKPTDLDPQIRHLTAKIAELDQRIRHGADRVLDCSEDVLDDVTQSLRTLKLKRHNLQAEVASLRSQAAVLARPSDWSHEKVMANLEAVARSLEEADQPDLQALLKNTIDRVVLHFDTIDGKQQLSGGEIHLLDSTDSGMAGAGFEPTTSRL